MIPKTIGRYRIKSELGRGGMSTVYLAHDLHFERDVAVKLLPLELLHQSTFRRRFEREAKVVAALDHPAIVPVYDFGEEKEQPFLVMRFMPGGSLSDRLKQGALSIKEASAIISQLAPALDEVHAHGIIHRDLKPSNILFDQRRDPFISDFGTAKLTQAQTKLTDTGGAVGTPAYMSPEQIQGDAELDGRSDIYSLGIILFEMLTGQHPYQTNTPIAVAVKHIFEPIPYILDVVPSLPAECQEILMQAMAKDRTQRYVTAVAFASDLANVADKIETRVLQALASEQEGRSQPGRYALLIKNNEFHDPMLSQLTKTGANIIELGELLQNPTVGAFDEVTTLRNEPTHVIRRAISQFFADRRPDDLLVVYYSGHAVIGSRSRLYLAAHNTEHNLLRGTAIPAGFVADEMDNSQSKHQILILDCHFSNAIETDLPSLVGQTVNSGATFARNGHNRVVITATDSTQYNWFQDKVRGKATPSQFTKHLVHGLRSGAADINQDGNITIDELFAYIFDRMSRNSVDEQIQVPRKWTPHSVKDGDGLVIGFANRHKDNVPRIHSAMPQATQSHSIITLLNKLPKTTIHAGAITILLLAIGLLFVTGGNRTRFNYNEQTAAAANITTSPTSVPAAVSPGSTPSVIPTVHNNSVAVSEPSPMAVTETMTVGETAVITPSPVPTSTPTEAATPESIAVAGRVITTTALLSSSLYSSPDSDSPEVTFVGTGEQVEILGRSQFGDWLYVRTEDFTEGYVYGPRFDYEGDFSELPVMQTSASAINTPAVVTCSGACPALKFDLYDLPSPRCTEDSKFRTIYFQGHGGSESYTYYWDGVYKAGPTSSGFGFDVSSPDGSAVIGRGKVVSGDGQVIEKELFVSNFSCNH